MEAEAGAVYFFRIKREEKGTIVHDLSNLHVTSIDSPDKKVLCKSRRHFGMLITSSEGHRKLYFLSYDMMLKGISYLLEAQNFDSRISQYVFIKPLS